MAGSGQTLPFPAATRDLRILARLSVAYLLDVVNYNRNGLDLLDSLLLSTVLQTNIAAIAQSPELTMSYATADAVPPDELRRPVTINAIAASLQLPFETVRRRLRKLAAADLCRIGAGGVIVPAAVANTPTYLANSLAAYERTREFYRQLRALGLPRGLPPSAPWRGGDAPPLRAVARLTNEYVLRVIEVIMLRLDDFIGGLILLQTMRSNTEHLGPDLRGAGGLAAEEIIPDSLRRPVKVATLAEKIGLPAETTRRHVASLIERGYCVRVRGGVMIPSAVMARDNVFKAITGNVGNLQRLFAGLAQLGVLSLWDRPRAAHQSG